MVSWIQALKALQKKPPKDSEWVDIYKELIAEKNDRGAALIAAAHVENGLRRLLEATLVELTEAELEALFERDAPFSSFSKLLRVTYALGYIDKEIRQNGDRIREIRNTFAHAGTIISFETEEIKRACSLLSASYDGLEGLNLAGEHAKVKYIGACVRILAILSWVGDPNRPEEAVKLPLKWSDAPHR